ncbi:NADH-quinone oxidoreductase subunit C [Streptomyces bambusae]|uniref:NADH-quinone oxidoreductase subunit C n=1 Tax=Streptomyces bambusae TaxID=1550616 RepID=UPI001CFEBC7A|nr:NADH-quinone oxidoreductase subunit C [Streptomyces bambusae]MCB5168750.1 NADH-quinone oxidoreductase subunit C [Streptomyces bambusae]
MNAYDGLPGNVAELFGAEATAEAAYDLLTVDVPAGDWIAALETARDKLGCTYFDWLSAVDEPGTGFRVCAHVAALEGGRVRRLLLRTTVPHAAAVLPTAIPVYAGAAWHERETHEMFGVSFTDHPHLVPLLLPENFEGHPLRKDFVLAARVAKAWPGAKEPGEGADHGGPKRRQMLPPGVPDPNDWGPMKGQLPPAPARPARTPRAAGEGPARTPRAAGEGPARAPRAPGEAPARRTRSVTEGSASQAADPAAAPAAGPETPARPVRRSRSASDGSASQATPATDAAPTDTTPAQPETPARPVRRSRSAADGSASQAQSPAAAPARPAPRSADAPWHHARPAFDEPAAGPAAEEAAGPTAEPAAEEAAEPAPKPEAESARAADRETGKPETPRPDPAETADTPHETDNGGTA